MSEKQKKTHDPEHVLAGAESTGEEITRTIDKAAKRNAQQKEKPFNVEVQTVEQETENAVEKMIAAEQAKAAHKVEEIRQIEAMAKAGKTKNETWRNFPHWKAAEFDRVFYGAGGAANEFEASRRNNSKQSVEQALNGVREAVNNA